MPFQIIQGNILDCRCDAVINPTDELFSGSGGLDRQIHLAAGPELREECRTLGRLEIGRAALTGAYGLPCRAVIHTVAPCWKGRDEELDRLRDCYRNSLRLALENYLSDLAFPLIGSGTRGFPREAVLAVAAEELKRFLAEHDEFTIRLVVHDREEFRPNRRLLDGLESYRRKLRTNASFPEPSFYSASVPMARPKESAREERASVEKARPRKSSARGIFPSFRRRTESAKTEAAPAPCAVPEPMFSTERLVLDESFSEMVMRKIDEAGFKKDSECYVRANIDRRLFSKIRSDVHYHPKKTTAVALAVALELNLNETRELLEKAGYTLSHSILFDVIVEYCILQKNYDIFEINELLFQYDQPLLGG